MIELFEAVDLGLGKASKKSDKREGFKKKNLEFSRFSGWVGLKKSIFQIKKKLTKGYSDTIS